jgi:hypothetical protein
MNKIFLGLSVLIILVLVFFAVSKPKSQPSVDSITALSKTTTDIPTPMPNAQSEGSNVQALSHSHANKPNPITQAAHEVDQVNLPPDTKSDMSIQPIDPETDPANQVLQP